MCSHAGFPCASCRCHIHCSLGEWGIQAGFLLCLLTAAASLASSRLPLGPEAHADIPHGVSTCCRYKAFKWLLLCFQGNVDPDEWMFLLTGGLGEADPMPNPAPEWLVDRAWKELCRLSKLPSFKVRQHAG